MRLSVIVPCYNAEATLGDCVSSLLSQDMADFEAILIDDGSTDGTAGEIARWAARDARVRAISQRNAGVSAARNAGLAAARGEWVTFVDADDLLPPGAFRALLAAATEDVDLVVGAHETFGEDGARKTVRPDTRWPRLSGEARRRAVALRLIEGDSVLNIMCGKLARREMIEREGLRLAPQVAVAEDALFNLEAALLARGVAYVDAVVYRYRMRADSATHTQGEETFPVHEPWFAAMREMLSRRGELERYFPAFLDSVALRLYKDGGVAGVVRGFNRRALPVLQVETLRREALSPYGRLLRGLCLRGLYPAAYPLIYPAQVARRKLTEAANRLRAGKERAV